MQIPLKNAIELEPKLVERARSLKRVTLVIENHPKQPMTDADMVVATLAYANGAELKLLDPTGPSKPAKGYGLGADDRETIKHDLQSVLDGRVAKDGRSPLNWMHLVHKGRYAIPVFHPVSGGYQLSYYHAFGHETHVIDMGLALLFDVTRVWQARLCRCQLGRCGLFFLEIRGVTGRPQRLYCADAHRTEAHDANGPARVRRSRSGVRLRNNQGVSL